MSIVINKMLSVLIFAAWFYVGTLVIKGLDRGIAMAKKHIRTTVRAIVVHPR